MRPATSTLTLTNIMATATTNLNVLPTTDDLQFDISRIILFKLYILCNCFLLCSSLVCTINFEPMRVVEDSTLQMASNNMAKLAKFETTYSQTALVEVKLLILLLSHSLSVYGGI